MRSITSANVACGYHAGDPGVMRETVRMARAAGVAIGAHPGLPGPRRVSAPQHAATAGRSRGLRPLSDRRARRHRESRRRAPPARQGRTARCTTWPSATVAGRCDRAGGRVLRSIADLVRPARHRAASTPARQPACAWRPKVSPIGRTSLTVRSRRAAVRDRSSTMPRKSSAAPCAWRAKASLPPPTAATSRCGSTRSARTAIRRAPTS